MRVIGRAGSSASHIARRRTRYRTLVSLVGLGLAVAAVTVDALALGVVVALIALATRHRLSSGIHAAKRGARGEQLVAERLRRLRPERLLLDLSLRGSRSDIDVVALGPMAATVEIKAGRGRMVAYDDGKVKLGGSWMHGRPLAQAAKHAADVAEYTDVRVEAVLCITAMRGRPRYVQYGSTEVLVTGARHVRRLLRRLPPVLTRGQARAIAHALRSGNNPSHDRTPSVN